MWQQKQQQLATSVNDHLEVDQIRWENSFRINERVCEWVWMHVRECVCMSVCAWVYVKESERVRGKNSEGLQSSSSSTFARGV